MNAAFKEWAVVCEALGNGQQSVIIRKGGIAEGRSGFAFRHDEFLLFPTWFHEQLEKTTLSADTPIPTPSEDELNIQFAVTVEWSHLVTDLGQLAKLRDFHVLQDSEVEARFHYDEPRGVHVAFVRVFRLEPAIRLKNEKKYGGCRSWLDLPETEGVAFVSVLSDEEHTRRRELLKELLDL